MAQSSDSTQKDNIYFNDPESGAEMARLTDQDRLITKGMGGLFPERSDLSGIRRILDIGCGPGGWALEVAYTYPETEVVGFDISRAMIDYANTRAELQHLNNAHFMVKDARNPLDFPDNSFDLVNARFIAFLGPAQWPKLMQECQRITRPGGVIRLTESEWAITNSPAHEQLYGMFYRAMKLAGQSFSPDGRHVGITPFLGRFLCDTGYQDIQKAAYVLDSSIGTEDHLSQYQNTRVFLKLLQPFLIKMGVTTQEEVDRLYEQALTEMASADYCSLWYFLSVWGVKPQQV
jgi:ubiquinone/menaquinone biosynthesis C-methylase UbiE